jgi:hypothetical protein
MDFCGNCKQQIYPNDERVETSSDSFHVECAESLGFQDDEG